MRMTRQASSGELTGERRPARVMMTPLTAFVLRHRRWIVGFWLLALVAGGAAAGKVPQRLSTDFSLPGQPGYVAAQQIMRVYGNGGRAPSILAVTVPAGETARADRARSPRPSASSGPRNASSGSSVTGTPAIRPSSPLTAGRPTRCCSRHGRRASARHWRPGRH